MPVKGKVLYVGGFELPDKNAAAQRVIANSRLFDLLGYDVTLIGTNRTLPAGISIHETKTLTEGFNSYSFPYPVGLKAWFGFLTGISYLCIIKEIKPQIIVAYNYPAVALYRLRNFCRSNNISLVADSTEWYALRGNIFFRMLKGLDNSLRMKFVHKRIDGLIAISSYLYDYYAGRKMPVIYLPPLVDKLDEKWLPIAYVPDDKFIRVVYTGSPGTGHKDRLDRIVRVVKSINARGKVYLKLQVVGVSLNQYVDTFMHDEKDTSEIPDVEFLGRLSHRETLEVLKKSDFQLILRDNNIVNKAGFPTKLVESIACGTPVIANRFSNVEDYIVAGKTGFIIDASNEEALLKSLELHLIISKDSILNMKNHCFAYNIFDFRLYEKQLADFLRRLN